MSFAASGKGRLGQARSDDVTGGRDFYFLSLRLALPGEPPPSSEGGFNYTWTYAQKKGAEPKLCSPLGIAIWFGLSYLTQVVPFQLPSSSDQVHLPEDPDFVLK